MPKLIVNPTSSARREIALSRTLLSIGRDPGNDLVLPDAMVSRRHAVIECRGSQYFIRDCNSSNGSLVNGDRVSERSLRDGDLVAIGTARLLFRDEFDMEVGAKVVPHPSSPRLHCSACGADYRKGDQFCRQCGAALAPSLPPKAICASCGTAVPLPAQFCPACGRALAEMPQPPAGDADPAKPTEGAPPPEEPQAAAAVDPVTPASSERPLGSPPVNSSRPSIPPAPQRQQMPAPSREAALRAPAPPRPVKRFPDTFRERVPSAAPQPRDASAMARLGAALVDHLLAGAIQAVVLAPVVWYWWSHPIPASPGQIPVVPLVLSLLLVPLALGLGCLYFLYGWGVRGATPGKALFGLVVQGSDGAFPIGMSRAVARLLGYVLSSALLGIGHLMIAIGGSGLHDKIAGTRVVREKV